MSTPSKKFAALLNRFLIENTRELLRTETINECPHCKSDELAYDDIAVIKFNDSSNNWMTLCCCWACMKYYILKF